VAAEIEGVCDPRFSRVRDAFADNFETTPEVGAAVAVVQGGEVVVDLRGGYADARRTRKWSADTLVNVFSTTKGWTSAVVHDLVDRGDLDLDAPVARYWPEFAAAGKGSIPVRALLDHRAGLPAVRDRLPDEAAFDWAAMTSALASEAPWWEPETRHGYHTFTFGWLLGEVVRRVTGETVGERFRARFAAPLGLDAFIGLDASHDARCADLCPPVDVPRGSTLFHYVLANPESVTAKAFANPLSMMMPATYGSRAWRGAQIPAANGHATAVAIARFYAALGSGPAALSREAITRCGTERSAGVDEVLRVPTRFSLGYMLSQEGAAFGAGPMSFGHPGAGGSVGFLDPDLRLGFGYVMNRMGTSILIDPRASKLITALYASL
jgi:CubicO group peptidase (beta-lactamase class C family)